MHPRRIASENQFMTDELCSDPTGWTREDNRDHQSFEQVRNTPGRGHGRNRRRSCPCPLATSSPIRDTQYRPRPADATFTIDRPRMQGHGLNETYEAGPFALDETFTIEDPLRNCGQRIDQGQQYPPQRGNREGCEFFLPMSPPGPSPPGLPRPPVFEPDYSPSECGTSPEELAEPSIMEGIGRMVEYGFDTLRERMRRIQEIEQYMCRMRGTQEEALRRLRELRRLATQNAECYLRQASDAWFNMGEFYFGMVGFADNIPEGPTQCMEGLQPTEVDDQNQCTELIRRAAIISRAINRELMSDSTLLGQLLSTFENLEDDFNRFQHMLPNLSRYIDWATQRTEVLQRFLSSSQCEFERFNLYCRYDDCPNEQPLCEEECGVTPPVTCSMQTPPPPTSPRCGSWSPAVSPRGLTNVLPRTPPDLPVRVQNWMSQAEGSPGEESKEGPYKLAILFEDYDCLEGQAINELNNSHETHALNESVNAMHRRQNSSD